MQAEIKILTRRIHFSKWDRDSVGFLTCKVGDWIFEAQSVVAHSWSTFRCCSLFLELINITIKSGCQHSVADCYFIVNVPDLPFASPIAIYR